MSETSTHNGRFPTDPTRGDALLILLAAALISQLSTEQADALAALLPWLLYERPR